MKHPLLVMLAAALVFTATSARAQEATFSETNAVARIAECLIQGPPDDWLELYMVVELAEPGAETGNVRYLAKRASAPDGPPVAYTPCDLAKPAKVLIEARKMEPPERKAWTGARLTLHNDGKFDLHYDYPKK